MKVIPFVNSLSPKDMQFYVSELSRVASETGGGLKPGDVGEILSSRDGKNWRTFSNINHATLYAVTKTVNLDKEFKAILEAAQVALGDEEGAVSVIKEFYRDAVASDVLDDGTITYWAIRDNKGE